MENKTKNKTEKQLPASNLALFLSYFKPHKALFIADMIFAVFVAAVDVAFPVVSRWTINTLLPRYNDFPEKTLKIFIWVIVLCVIAYILHTLANVFVTYFGHMFGVHVETDMRRDIFRHIQNQSFAFFDSNRTGKIMSRITTDLFEISEMAHHGPEDLFISLLTLIGSFVIMLSVRWQMALIIFVVFPSLLFAMLLSRKTMIDTSRRVKATTAEINSDIESAISGIRVTKAFANEEFEQKKFDESNLRYFKSKSLYYRAMAVFLSRKDFLSSIMGVIVLAAGGYFVMKGEMTLGDLVAANLFVVAFLQPVKRLTGLVEQFSTGIAGFLRFAETRRQVLRSKHLLLVGYASIRTASKKHVYAKRVPRVETVVMMNYVAIRNSLVGRHIGIKAIVFNSAFNASFNHIARTKCAVVIEEVVAVYSVFRLEIYAQRLE